MPPDYDVHPGLGRDIFGDAELGDRRRTRRLVKTFDRMCTHPGGTLPDKLASPPDLRGLYRLCDGESMTHEAVLKPARANTRTRIEACTEEVLILHDASELDYTTLKSLAGDLGQIGKGDRRGYLCHNVLAVTADSGEVLGLMDQLLHRRDEVPDGETLTEHRDRPTRESRLWVLGTRHLPADPRLIDVADQGADTFEFLEHESQSGRRFVVHAAKPRKVHAVHEPTGPRHELKAYARGLPELGRFTMDVQAQPGRKARSDAEFIVRGEAVLVCPPHAKAGHRGDDPLPMYVAQVTEVSPPKGEEAIAWTLLTNERVSTFEDAWRVIGWYERRWVVETAFQELESSLNSEVNTLGYPKAALFAFCVALVAYNVLSTVKGALRSVHGEETVADEVSGYYVADEIQMTHRGMMVAIAEDEWVVFHDLAAVALAEILVGLARSVSLAKLRKHPRGPKTPKPKKQSGATIKHVATEKILKARQACTK